MACLAAWPWSQAGESVDRQAHSSGLAPLNPRPGVLSSVLTHPSSPSVGLDLLQCHTSATAMSLLPPSLPNPMRNTLPRDWPGIPS